MELSSRDRHVVFFFVMLGGPLWILVSTLFNLSFGFRWGNGDHLYYVAHSQLFKGVEYREALRFAAENLSYARPSEHLDYEWLDPAIAPLLYPRTVIPMSMAVTTSLFRSAGIYVPTLIFGTLTSYIWYRILCAANVRRIALLLAVGIGLSPSLVDYRFGLYTESPLLLALSILVYLMLVEGKKTLHFSWRGSALLSLIVLVSLIRQSSLVVILPLVVWTIARFVRERQRGFLGYAGVILAVGLLVNLVVGKWAPYDPIPYVMEQIGSSDRDVAIKRILTSAPERLSQEVNRMVQLGDGFDVSYLALVLVLPLLLIARRRSLFVWPTAAAFVVSLLVTTTNFRLTSLRYTSVVIPFALALVVHDDIRRRAISLKSDLVKPISILMVLVTATAVTWTLVEAHEPRKQLDWHPIAPQSVAFSWDLIFPRGEIACDKDELQVWIRDDQGQLYAASGSALRHRFWAKSIEEASTIKRATLRTPLIAFTNLGLTYCGTTFMGEEQG